MAIRFDGRIVDPSDLAKYSPVMACDADRVTVVDDPLLTGRKVIRAVRKITDTVVLSGYRAEAYTLNYKRIPPFVEWYDWDCLLFKNQFLDSYPNPFIFFQVHDDWGSGGAPHLPPIMVGVYDSSLNVLVHSSSLQNPSVPSEIEEIKAITDVPIIWDAWARIVIRAKFATDSTGELDIWYGGDRVCALRAINNAYPGNSLFVQTGAYTGLAQLREPTAEKIVYSTGVRINDDSTTHAEMGVSELISLCAQGALR